MGRNGSGPGAGGANHERTRGRGVWERNGQAMSGMSVGAETAFNCQIWPADGRWLAAIRAELRGWLAAFALSDELEDDLVLAVNEAASNSVEHAYLPPTPDGTVELTFWTEHGSICIEIVDHGAWRATSGSATEPRPRDRDHGAAPGLRHDPLRRPRDAGAPASAGARRRWKAARPPRPARSRHVGSRVGASRCSIWSLSRSAPSEAFDGTELVTIDPHQSPTRVVLRWLSSVR